jgi:hypothetical protein
MVRIPESARVSSRIARRDSPKRYIVESNHESRITSYRLRITNCAQAKSRAFPHISENSALQLTEKRLKGVAEMATEEKGSGNKPRRIFLIGMLCGVLITAAVTFVFAIPANSDRWRMEIWKRGGAAWTFDKNGHLSWKWMLEPTRETLPAKRIIVPSSRVNVHCEKL